jgi:hypothetical protein
MLAYICIRRLEQDAVKRVYRGKLVLAQDDVHGPKDILYLIDPKSPEHLSYCEDCILARQVARDMGRYGRYLSIQYWTSDKVIGERKIQKAFLDWLEGVGDANYSVTYTETSGYLWTTEQLQVGGHDLLAELKSYAGKFLLLKIVYQSVVPPEKIHHADV